MSEVTKVGVSLHGGSIGSGNKTLISEPSFEELIKKSEEAHSRIKNYDDLDLKLFYKNASDGFKSKARNLTL